MRLTFKDTKMYAVKQQELDSVPGNVQKVKFTWSIQEESFTSPLDMSKYSLASSISVGQLEDISAF